jgi:hypothetical protein
VWYGRIEQLEPRNQNLFVYAFFEKEEGDPKDLVKNLKWKLHIRGKNSN